MYLQHLTSAAGNRNTAFPCTWHARLCLLVCLFVNQFTTTSYALHNDYFLSCVQGSSILDKCSCSPNAIIVQLLMDHYKRPTASWHHRPLSALSAPDILQSKPSSVTAEQSSQTKHRLHVPTASMLGIQEIDCRTRPQTPG